MKRNGYIEGMSDERPWVKAESDRMAQKFASDAEVNDGIVTWKSNGRVPPQDILEFWAWLGKGFDLKASTGLRELQTAQAIAAYKQAEANRQPSAEEMSEMRAAFGPGVEVVNVITGRRVRT